ncbi:MAG: hypothetical protein H0X12_01290 [Nocardioides sp.]|nr:hypothetical protein [Nocardioides sp.]
MVPRSRLSLRVLTALALTLGAVVAVTWSRPDDGAVVDPVASRRCAPVALDDVQGPRPSEATRLRAYRLRNAACSAYWIAELERDFVPQGLNIRGDRAFVSGYVRVPKISERACQLVEVDLATGRTVTFVPRWEAKVYGDQPTYCRHGGGTALTRDGLWVAEAERLWLLDPDALDTADPVKRVWRLGEGIKGSTLGAHGGQLGLASYRVGGRGRIATFDIADLVRPGVTVVDPARVASRGRVPARLQGLDVTADGAWRVSSRITCGLVKLPDGEVRDFVPGAEDLVVTDDLVWTVSEASATPYRSDDGAFVPALLAFERSVIEGSGPATCGL